VLAGVQEFFEYERQDMRVVFDDGEERKLVQPVILTIANLTQFGGGAVIAPHAKADDGRLEFISALQRDFPLVLANLGRLFNGSMSRIPQIYSRSAQSMRIERAKAGPVQLDGELVEMDATVDIKVLPRALRVLVPPLPALEERS
jgi:diacylglycerol kinase (ATP)